ncbi:hypothetical protein Fmac_005971 [Flemingia macrophylla]|uniref:Uncharacterized protein n=1 Tax=Flemingia macrophylla TaxID=520843 RepID=A0ABD1N9T2_9FABA
MSNTFLLLTKRIAMAKIHPADIVRIAMAKIHPADISYGDQYGRTQILQHKYNHTGSKYDHIGVILHNIGCSALSTAMSWKFLVKQFLSNCKDFENSRMFSCRADSSLHLMDDKDTLLDIDLDVV